MTPTYTCHNPQGLHNTKGYTRIYKSLSLADLNNRISYMLPL